MCHAQKFEYIAIFGDGIPLWDGWVLSEKAVPGCPCTWEVRDGGMGATKNPIVKPIWLIISLVVKTILHDEKRIDVGFLKKKVVIHVAGIVLVDSCYA